MATYPLLILLGLIIFLILISILHLLLKKTQKRPRDYYNIFTIRLVGFAIRIPLRNILLSTIGIIFLKLGLADKSKFKLKRFKKDKNKEEI